MSGAELGKQKQISCRSWCSLASPEALPEAVSLTGELPVSCQYHTHGRTGCWHASAREANTWDQAPDLKGGETPSTLPQSRAKNRKSDAHKNQPDTEDGFWPHNRHVFSNKQNWNADTCYNTEEPWKYYGEFHMVAPKDHSLYDPMSRKGKSPWMGSRLMAV